MEEKTSVQQERIYFIVIINLIAVYALWKIPSMLPFVEIHSGVFKYLEVPFLQSFD